MTEYLSAEQILDEVDTYCATQGNPTLAPHMRAHWEKTGKMAPAVLVSLKLRPVTVFVRVA